MPISSKVREKLRAAFANDQIASVDDPLPVKAPYAERVPVRGSVLIASGRVISRMEINKRFDKSFSK